MCQRLSHTWLSICKNCEIGPGSLISNVKVAPLRCTWASSLHRGQAPGSSLQARCVQSCYSASELIRKELGCKRGITVGWTVGQDTSKGLEPYLPSLEPSTCIGTACPVWGNDVHHSFTGWITEWMMMHAESCPKQRIFLNTRNWNVNTRKTLDWD